MCGCRTLRQAAEAFAKATDMIPLGLGFRDALIFGGDNRMTLLLSAFPGPLSNLLLREKVPSGALARLLPPVALTLQA